MAPRKRTVPTRPFLGDRKCNDMIDMETWTWYGHNVDIFCIDIIHNGCIWVAAWVTELLCIESMFSLCFFKTTHLSKTLQGTRCSWLCLPTGKHGDLPLRMLQCWNSSCCNRTVLEFPLRFERPKTQKTLRIFSRFAEFNACCVVVFCGFCSLAHVTYFVLKFQAPCYSTSSANIVASIT